MQDLHELPKLRDSLSYLYVEHAVLNQKEMLLEKVPLRLRGELTRWLLEPRSGVFVGHVNAMVRERLWEKCCKARGAGGVAQLWSTNHEQHFAMRMSGDTSRRIVELEGLQLIQVPLEPGEDVEEGESAPPDMDKKP